MDPSRRIFVNWRNMETGLDCKAIGPQSMCLCTHRYNEHDWGDFENRRVRCKMPGCGCKCFSYVPVRGSGDLKCSHCKRSYTEHNPMTHGCPSGDGGTFTSDHICSCTSTYAKHRTIFESRTERIQAGRAVTSAWMDKAVKEGLPVCHLGGILGFTSLADGADRAMAGLEQGFQPADMAARGAVPDSGADRFVRQMQVHDDVTNASVLHGKAAGYRALAKAKQQQRRSQSAVAPSPTTAVGAVPGASRANVHSFSSGSRGSSPPRPLPAPSTPPTAKASPRPRAPGSAQSPHPKANSTGPSVVSAMPRSRSAVAPSAGRGHRLGGVTKSDPEAIRRARLAHFES